MLKHKPKIIHPKLGNNHISLSSDLGATHIHLLTTQIEIALKKQRSPPLQEALEEELELFKSINKNPNETPRLSDVRNHLIDRFNVEVPYPIIREIYGVKDWKPESDYDCNSTWGEIYNKFISYAEKESTREVFYTAGHLPGKIIAKGFNKIFPLLDVKGQPRPIVIKIIQMKN